LSEVASDEAKYVTAHDLVANGDLFRKKWRDGVLDRDLTRRLSHRSPPLSCSTDPLHPQDKEVKKTLYGAKGLGVDRYVGSVR
jgi:hypothetical protein